MAIIGNTRARAEQMTAPRSLAQGLRAAASKYLVVFAALLTAGLAAAPAAAQEARIFALGDSLTAGYELAPGQGFVAQLEAALREKGYAVSIVDGGVSGDTSAGGLARLGWALDDTITHAIVQLGANDALRGLDPADTKSNLAAIIRMLKDRRIKVLLAGMLAPRNLGPDYAAEFDALYPALAEEFGVALYPFFMEGVVGNPDLFLPDGLHPTGEGVAVIVETILPFVERLLTEDASAAPSPALSSDD